MVTKNINETTCFSPDRSHLIVSQIKNSIVIVIAMTAIIYKMKQMDNLPIWISPVVIGGMHCIFLPILISVRHSINRRQYSFESDKIICNIGLFKRKTVNIYYRDIKKITLSKDPLERLFKINRINISTTKQKLSIKGIKNAKANEIKELIYKRC